VTFQGKQRERRREGFREGRHSRIGEGIGNGKGIGIVSRSLKKRIVGLGFSAWNRISLSPFFFRIWFGCSIRGI
jgi:hypothetical protein